MPGSDNVPPITDKFKGTKLASYPGASASELFTPIVPETVKVPAPDLVIELDGLSKSVAHVTSRPLVFILIAWEFVLMRAE